MSKNNLKLSNLILEAKIMIENVIPDKKIRTVLANFGYDEAKLSSGKALLEEMQRIINMQKKKYRNQYEAGRETWKSWEKANAIYMRTLKVARVALQNNAKAESALMLYGDRKKNLSGWLSQTKTFYENLMGDADLMNEMHKIGCTMERLNEEYGFVKDVMVKNLLQKKETNEAQEAAEMRNKKIDEFYKWISNFRAIAKVALSDDPQKMEKLGIFARGKVKVKRKKPATVEK
jgi:hypothetical protein